MSYKYDVFLSFSSKDEKLARDVWKNLSMNQLNVFWSDETLKKNIGESFFSIIQQALVESEHFILICTSDSLKSNWVKKEYETFFNQCHINSGSKRKIFILLTYSCSKTNIPPFLRDIQSSSTVEEVVRLLIENKKKEYKKYDLKKERKLWLLKPIFFVITFITLIIILYLFLSTFSPPPKTYDDIHFTSESNNYKKKLIDFLSINKHGFIKMEFKVYESDVGEFDEFHELFEGKGNKSGEEYSIAFSLDPCTEKSLSVAPERKSYNNSSLCQYQLNFEGSDHITRCHGGVCDIIGYFYIKDIDFESTEGFIHYDLRSLKPENIPK